MKISFSTVGCPNYTWNEIISTAKDLGYDGIELRGLLDELKVYRATPFTKENITKTIKRLEELNLEISCISTSCYIFDKNSYEQSLCDVIEYLKLSKNLKCKNLRVLADEWIAPSNKVNENFVRTKLKELCEIAKEFEVDILIETNGVWADSRRLYELLKDFPYENVGVVWDVHHPFRFFSEEIKFTYNNIKDFVKHVHIKDSKMENDKLIFKMIGEGDVPIKQALQLLIENGYKGYVSLEWVKRWFSDLEEPDVVFSQFIDKIRAIIG